jgi:hypothetical protein
MKAQGGKEEVEREFNMVFDVEEMQALDCQGLSFCLPRRSGNLYKSVIYQTFEQEPLHPSCAWKIGLWHDLLVLTTSC